MEQPAVTHTDEIPAVERAYRSILVGVDASDHSNRGVKDALDIAHLWKSTITGAHVYAARMHDRRFRQMEGGLPEEYREEKELEKQRDIHDDLITKGLGVITDSYLDQVETSCSVHDLKYVRRSLEGKNYQEMVKETNSGGYDLLILGSLGLGAVQSSRIGTVCERVVRRSSIDTLVIKDAVRSLRQGPIMVAIDGSPRAYGGLLSALTLARHWRCDVHVVSAYDPYYHYVAFNRIAGVLSEEAGKVFRFKEQEKLHEDIIDAGLAKIYQSHLDVAESIAAEHGVEITTKLLDGKPYEVIEAYQKQLNPSLLVLGKLGIHADEGLDIGGQAENLLRNVSCSVLLSQTETVPPLDKVAEATTSWTHEAEARMESVPSFARGMARMAVLRFSQERGHTVVTERIVAEATSSLCPVHGMSEGEEESGMTISTEAEALLESIDSSDRDSVLLRAEKKARQSGAYEIGIEHVRAFAPDPVAEDPVWTPEALSRLERVPDGFMRTLTRQRIDVFATQGGHVTVTPEIMDAKYNDWAKGSIGRQFTLEWDKASSNRIERTPPFVRGMIIKEVEQCARDASASLVTEEIVNRATKAWASNGTFHSEMHPEQYTDSTDE